METTQLDGDITRLETLVEQIYAQNPQFRGNPGAHPDLARLDGQLRDLKQQRDRLASRRTDATVAAGGLDEFVVMVHRFEFGCRIVLEQISRMQLRRAGGKGGVNLHHRVAHLPCDGEISRIEAGHRLGVTHNGGDGIAPEKHVIDREDRLVDETWDHAKGVQPRHIGGGQHGNDAGMGRAKGIKIAEGEPRMGMGGSDDAQHQRTGGGHVIAESLGAGDLGEALRTAPC